MTIACAPAPPTAVADAWVEMVASLANMVESALAGGMVGGESAGGEDVLDNGVEVVADDPGRVEGDWCASSARGDCLRSPVDADAGARAHRIDDAPVRSGHGGGPAGLGGRRYRGDRCRSGTLRSQRLEPIEMGSRRWSPRSVSARSGRCSGWRSPGWPATSPLLANIYLHAFDRAWNESGTGALVRYADDFVVLCSTRHQAEQAQQQARALLGGLGLELHPDKTRVVDLREGKEGFDFLGCHLHARMSGRVWEQRGIVRYYLHRWPSQRSMKRARLRVKDLTDRRRVGMELADVIAGLNLFLRGWGNYFRTGNASDKFRQLDRHVGWRLKRLLIKKWGRNLRAGQAGRWTESWFHNQGLHNCSAPSDTRRRRNHVQKTAGKPYAGKPHVRIERGMGKQGRYAVPAPLTTNG